MDDETYIAESIAKGYMPIKKEFRRVQKQEAEPPKPTADAPGAAAEDADSTAAAPKHDDGRESGNKRANKKDVSASKRARKDSTKGSKAFCDKFLMTGECKFGTRF